MKKTAGVKDRVTIIPITERGYELAAGLESIAEKVRIYRPGEVRGGKLKGLVHEAFTTSRAIVFVGASGIAVRAIAPLLQGKDKDPAVVVMDEKARFVISLLSGHLGGANRLAEEIAAILKATPVVTTATDVNDLPCIEDVALRFNLAIENVRSIKALNSAILAGGPLMILDKNQERLGEIKAFLNKRVEGLFSLGRSSDDGEAGVCAMVSSRLEVSIPERLRGRTLIFRPREFVVGVGCRRGTTAKEIEEAVDGVFQGQGVSPLCIKNIATIDIKGDEEGLIEFVDKRGLELQLFTADELNTRAGKGSAFVLKATGARAVSEPAALISSGVKELWITKQKTARVTVAVARVSYTS